MKKFFTLIFVALTALGAYADKVEITPSYLADAKQEDGSYKVEFAKAWDWVNLAWIAGEESTPFDASAYSYLIVEYAEALPFANKIIMQNGDWQSAAEATSPAGSTYTEIELSEAAKTSGMQICAQNATSDFGIIYIKSIYFSTEKYDTGEPEADTQAIALSSVANLVENNDGTYTVPGGWSWNNIWYGSVDWSEYDYVVAELASSEATTKIQIEYENADPTEAYAQAGELKITAALDATGKSSVKQIALQGEADFTIKAFYLVKGTATAIKGVDAPNASNTALFNLAGQQVNKNYKGIVVKNGKKYLNK